jgi:hypothetical protein
MQQVRRIGIFTKHSMRPKHPRIQMEQEVLIEAGYEVEIHCNPEGFKGNHGGVWNKIRYYLSLTYFHWPLIDRFKRQTNAYDAVLIYDLALLPLLKSAKNQGKHVVYETIDNNVAYTFHALEKRIPFFRVFKGPVMGRMKSKETKFAQEFADHVIVNSPALKDFIGTSHVSINPYASPFEFVELERGEDKPLAFLYLGEFTKDKGGDRMLELAAQTGIPFLIFGNVRERELKEKISDLQNVQQQDRMNIVDLERELVKASRQYRMAGFSLILPVNLSFATQEANKDIDYLALGIPIIGNERGITKEKVDAGCGVMHNDEIALGRLIEDARFYNTLSETCTAFYADHYSRKAFTKVLLAAFETSA